MEQRLMGGTVSILHRGKWEQTGEVTVGRAISPGPPEWLQDREGHVGSLDSTCFLGNWPFPNPSLVRPHVVGACGFAGKQWQPVGGPLLGGWPARLR